MSEWTLDEKKQLLRSQKHLEALENQVQGLHFWIWRRELKDTPIDYDDDPIDDDPGPPPGWTPELN